MNWQRKHKYYATSDAGYVMCWTDQKPTLYMCSYRQEFIGKSNNADEAKDICEEHKTNNKVIL